MASRVRASRAKGKYIWTAILIEGFNVPITPVAAEIVIGTDFAAHSGREGVTLMAIRGWLSYTAQTGTGGDTLMQYIAVIDENEGPTSTSLDPAAIDTYVSEDILWTGGWSKQEATNTGSRESFVEQINVKARRKINTGQEVRLQMTTTNDEIQVSGVLRGLLKIA